MSGTTANRALRYPDPTDRVTDGATAIKNLATDVDGALVKLARKVAIVEMAFAFGGGNQLSQTVPWPAGRFAPGDVPLVIVSIRGSGNAKAIAHQVAVATDTGVQVRIASVDATAMTGTFYAVVLGVVL